MNTFVTLIVLMCQQPGVGHGARVWVESPSKTIREQAFAAQTACVKRLFSACIEKHKITGAKLPGSAECLVEKL